VDSDAELLARVRAGDEAAFVTLVEGYHGSLLRVARGYVPNEAVAEEVVQETWMGVVRGIEGFEGRSSFKTWLFRILVNRARTSGQSERRQVPVDTADAESSVAGSRFDARGAWTDPPTPFTDLVDRRLDDAGTVAAIRSAIAALPEPQQAVVTLRDVEGLSTYEVSSLLALTEGNVRVILHRARAKVRAAIEDSIRGGGS
jgi:RNA polymerase sigma-70 factor (ECF subfamily)